MSIRNETHAANAAKNQSLAERSLNATGISSGDELWRSMHDDCNLTKGLCRTDSLAVHLKIRTIRYLAYSIANRRLLTPIGRAVQKYNR